MRIIARANLSAFWVKHPEARTALERWTAVMKQADCGTTAEVQALFPKAKVLDGQRVRFEISGGDYRLIASFKFKNRLVFVKLVDTHAEYDRIDALTIAQF